MREFVVRQFIERLTWGDLLPVLTRNELHYYKPRNSGVLTMKSKIAKRCSRTAPKFTWIGGLKEFRGEYTSVQLQEKASDWMVESAARQTN